MKLDFDAIIKKEEELKFMFFKKKVNLVCINNKDSASCSIIDDLRIKQERMEAIDKKIRTLFERSGERNFVDVGMLFSQLYAYKNICEKMGYNILQDLTDYFTYKDLISELNDDIREDKEKLGIR